MSSAVVVIATLHPAKGRRKDVRAALVAAIDRVHKEDDKILIYALHEGPDSFVMIEKYVDDAALGAHAKSEALAELTAALEGALTEPMGVQVLAPQPAGDAAKGEL